MIVGFREIGCGFSAIKNFTQSINMHNIGKIPLDNLNHEIAKSYEISGTKSMKTAAENIKIALPQAKRAKFDGGLAET